MGKVTCLAEPKTFVNNNLVLFFKDLDPTGIIRLHAILSGKDIFELAEKYNYKTTRNLDNSFELQLPESLKLLHSHPIKN